MPLNSVCDKCDVLVPKDISSIIIYGGVSVRVLCKECWIEIEEQILKEKEPVNS